MRASILVKSRQGKIENRFETSIDEATVKEVVRMLERRYPAYVIDTSQIDLARKAQELQMRLVNEHH